MSREAVVAALDALGFARDAYDVEGFAPTEKYCMHFDGRRWAVFYSERGFRSDEVMHDSEDAALDDLIRRLMRDETTRRAHL